MTVTTPPLWANRILESATVPPAELRANPLNYRRHPAHQRAALREMLDAVGWVQQVVVNRRTGNLVDGHLRVDLAETEGVDVPVLYVDLDEREERLVLAALDPIAALADVDGEALTALLADVAIDGDALTAMLGELATPVDESEVVVLVAVDTRGQQPHKRAHTRRVIVDDAARDVLGLH